MKSFTVLSIFVITVLLSKLDATDDGQSRRVKRQADQWIWGDNNKTDSNTRSQIIPRSEEQASTEPPESTTELNPCSIEYDPQTPDFSAPGRRISEVKCYEFLFDIKVREEKAKIDNECAEYIRKNNPHRKKNGGHAVGGRNTLPGEFPHMGAIGWQAVTGTWLYKCGGSLISEKFVLTAAHCSKASERDTTIADVVPKVVRLGDKNLQARHGKPKNIADIKRVIDHPSYKAPKKYFDIALIELTGPVKFDKFIQPVCLGFGDGSTLVGKDATLTGWGVVETVSKATSPELQAAVVEIFNNPHCDQLLKPSCNRHWCGMQDDQLCAGRLKGGVDACQGDSGGPLQIKIPLPNTTSGRMYHIVGVTSFGIGCALPNLPGIYTRVASFIGWIENIVWQ